MIIWFCSASRSVVYTSSTWENDNIALGALIHVAIHCKMYCISLLLLYCIVGNFREIKMLFDFIATALHASGEQLAHENNEFFTHENYSSSISIWCVELSQPVPSAHSTGSESGCVEVYDVRGDPVPFAIYSPHIRSVQRLTFAPWK